MDNEHEGKGGSYIVENGVTRLVERTQDHPDGNRPRAADGTPIGNDGKPVEPEPAAAVVSRRVVAPKLPAALD
jgi:hypothetical protein